jgi:hypothetical protein
MSKPIVFSSLILSAGNSIHCPICGEDKISSIDFICESCNEKLGEQGVQTAISIYAAIDLVIAKNKHVDGGENKRTTINHMPVLAQIKISEKAEPMTSEDEAVGDYYKFLGEMLMEEEGGLPGSVPIYAFGFDMEDIGRTFPVLFSFKKKEVLYHCDSNYIRVQKVKSPSEFLSDVRLYITGSKEMTRLFVPELPQIRVINFLHGKGKRKARKGKELTYYVGFLKM